MAWNNYLSIITLAITLFLGIFVFFKNFKSNINQFFGLFVLSVVFWIFSNLMVDVAKEEVVALLWSKLALVGPILLAYFFLCFSLVFPKEERGIKPVRFVLYFIPSLMLLSFVPTRFNIEKILSVSSLGPPEVKAGVLYYPFVIYLVAYLGLASYKLIKKFNVASSIEKSQIKLIFLGVAISSILAIITNVILLLADVSRIASIGPLFSIILVSFTAYAIVIKRLFDIRIILTETATAIVVLAFFIQTLLSKTVIQGIFNGGILILTTYGGFLLIKSVQQEIKRREQLQRLTEQLEIANAHLKELDRMKTEFVSLASHELLTPVSAIEGYLSMMLDEKMATLEDPKAVKYMGRIYTSAKRLARLVTDMLNVSRIEEGRLLVEKHDVHLTELVEQVIEELKFKAEEKQQKVVFANPNHWDSFGDSDKIKEIIINLIGNSIKYSRDPGTITLTIEKVPTSEVAEKWQKVEDEIKARPLDDQEAIKSAVDPHLRDLVGPEQLLISVKDQGIGIPKEELPRLFKKFHRVGDYSRAESQGTGLGLYISRALVELHHGRVWADSEGPSHGSTFTFSLPEHANKQAIIDLEAQVPQQKEQLKPLARPPKEAEEI